MGIDLTSPPVPGGILETVLYARDLKAIEDFYRRVLGLEHPETLSSTLESGLAQRAQHKWAESERSLRDAHDGYARRYPEQIGRFLALSGIGPESLRAAAREPGFLLGVIDFVGGDEKLLLAFAADRGIDPAAVGNARAALAGERPGTEPS